MPSDSPQLKNKLKHVCSFTLTQFQLTCNYPQVTTCVPFFTSLFNRTLSIM